MVEENQKRVDEDKEVVDEKKNPTKTNINLENLGNKVNEIK